jgi:hypothetical protein
MLRVAEQERRAHQASLRAERVLQASRGRMRKAERKAKEGTYRSEELKWTIEAGGIRPRSLLGSRPLRASSEEGREQKEDGASSTD